MEVRRPLSWVNNKGIDLQFECVINIPYSGDIPSEIDMKVCIPENFPFEIPLFLPQNEKIKGFAHQPGGALCLGGEHENPQNDQTLVYFASRARQWLCDAAQGNLAKPGEPYELPFFVQPVEAQLQANLPSPLKTLEFIFSEDSESYVKWKDYIGNWGDAQCYPGPHEFSFFVGRYLNQQGQTIWQAKFRDMFLQGLPIKVRWLLLPDVKYERHRPPGTYMEVMKTCDKYGIDLEEVSRVSNTKKMRVVLIGFPIPKKYGEDPCEIHWQPLIDRQNFEQCGSDGIYLPSFDWGISTNITEERLYKRGAYSYFIRTSHFAIFGCGALGSMIAELLARGGVKKMELFDPDALKYGNLCRHTLDATEIGQSKAKALAIKLSFINPFASINGHPIRVPLSRHHPPQTHEALLASNVLIDCTTKEGVSNWASQYVEKHGKRIISVYFNLYAELLAIYISGRLTTAKDICQDMENCIREGKNRTVS